MQESSSPVAERSFPEGSGEYSVLPHCGSPQLFLSLENQSLETGGEAAQGAEGCGNYRHSAPPSPRQVEWKTAIPLRRGGGSHRRAAEPGLDAGADAVSA